MAVTSERTDEYVLWFSFLVTGIIAIVNISIVMYKVLLKLGLAPTVTPRTSASFVLDVQTTCNNKSCEENQQNHFVANGHCNRNVHSVNTGNSLTSFRNICTPKQQLVTNRGKLEEWGSSNLMSLLLYCCFIENICIVTFAATAGEFVKDTSAYCSTLDYQSDCIVINSLLLFHKNYLSLILDTLRCAILSAVPIALCLVTRYFQSYVNNILRLCIILFSVLLSRCFSYLLFPHFILQSSDQSCTLQRLFSSWITFLSMSYGVKLAHEKSPEILHVTRKNSCEAVDDLDQRVRKQNVGQFIKKSNSFPCALKQNNRRLRAEMTFGSDAFIPCVVLMKDQVMNPYKQNVNVGTTAKNPRNRRRASLDVIKEHSVIEEAVKWSALKRRRTSLPTILTGSKKKAVMSSVLVDTSTLSQVHSIVEELAKMPTNIGDFVKKLQDLLNPYKLDQVKPRQVVWLHNSSDTGNDEALCVNPRHLISKRSSQRRSETHSGLFSTTTTATGLPKEEPGPTKSKRISKIPKDKTPLNTPIDSRCSSPIAGCPHPQHMNRRKTYPSIPVSKSTKFPFTHLHHSTNKKFSAMSPDYESDDPSSLVVPLTNQRSPSAIDDYGVSQSQHHYSTDDLPRSTHALHQEFTTAHPAATRALSIDAPSFTDNDSYHCNQFLGEQTNEGHVLFRDYQEMLLESVYRWNFQIFELAEKTDCVLSQMAFKLFQNTGLFETFKIPKVEFVLYMKALENGYREIPYHNRIHAADVLHGCWYLTTQEIPGFNYHSTLFSSDSSDSDSVSSTINTTRQVDNIGHGSLAQAIPALELMALYLAAAMHDYDHPGRTNAFLVETRHPLAILYNDRSVLENHHASASWELLYSNRNFDFLRNLEIAEWKRLRFLIVEAILATDLKKHFDILSQFSAKAQQPLSRCTSTEDGVMDNIRKNGVDWKADQDRLLVCQMVIKLADIGGPAKIKPLHITWTKAICEEFFIQGDEERRLNVPVSPFMDREKPQVAELQRTFINNLIKPIVVSMQETGILAGEIPGEHDIPSKPTKEDGLRNLLEEQLNSNLSFWEGNLPSNGHEEMTEAFKHALPFRLGDMRSPEKSPAYEEKSAVVNPHFNDNNNKLHDVIIVNTSINHDFKEDTSAAVIDDVLEGQTTEMNEVFAESIRTKSKQRRPYITITNSSTGAQNVVLGDHISLPNHLPLSSRGGSIEQHQFDVRSRADF